MFYLSELMDDSYIFQNILSRKRADIGMINRFLLHRASSNMHFTKYLSNAFVAVFSHVTEYLKTRKQKSDTVLELYGLSMHT